MKTLFALTLLLVMAVLLSSCSDDSDIAQNEQQAQLATRSSEAVGLPAIIKFTEKRTLKSIYELRDKEVPTWTYITDSQGHFHLVCHSVGYGIPYATQYSDPRNSDGSRQADPNGLFGPAVAEGTWVLCLNPETQLIAPVYLALRIIVSPFALPADK